MNTDRNLELQTSNFEHQKKLNIYFTAGIPTLEDTGKIAELIQNSGANMMEIGIPYSDPVADGPVIQDAHTLALKNGMTIKKLFEQLAEIKDSVAIPKILMGYFNPVLQFGFEKFCKKERCHQSHRNYQNFDVKIKSKRQRKKPNYNQYNWQQNHR